MTVADDLRAALARLFRRVALCQFKLCRTFCTNSDESGIWGECSICGKRSGFVTREELRAFADRAIANEEHHDRA